MSLQILHSPFSIWPIATGVPAIVYRPPPTATHAEFILTYLVYPTLGFGPDWSVTKTFQGSPGQNRYLPTQSPGPAVEAKAAAANLPGPRDVKDGHFRRAPLPRPTIQATDATRSTL